MYHPIQQKFFEANANVHDAENQESFRLRTYTKSNFLNLYKFLGQKGLIISSCLSSGGYMWVEGNLVQIHTTRI